MIRISTSRLALAVITIAAGIGAAAFAQGAAPDVWSGVYAADQAERGKAGYEQACVACHGPALNGGDSAPPLAGATFLNNWNSTSAGDLFERIRTTMPANDPGSLSGKQVAEIEAYILSVNGFPHGATPLAGNAQLLKGIKIVATKPH